MRAQHRAEGPIRRFDHNKHEWGFGKFLSLDTLNEYPANDTLVLGAEVFVIVSTGRKECVSILKNPDGATTHTWKIPNFSALDDNPQFSQAYTVDERKWKLRLYPMGTAAGKGEFLALDLMLVDVLDPAPKRAVFAEFDLLLVDQKRHSITASNDNILNGFPLNATSWGTRNSFHQLISTKAMWWATL